MTQEDEQQKDLDLLERVFYRLAMADSDEKLETSIAQFLCPVILKLSSESNEVRTKVVEILSHINKRLGNPITIKLPLYDLLKQYTTAANKVVKNFTFTYLEKSFSCHDVKSQSAWADDFIAGVSGCDSTQLLKYLRLISPAVLSRELPVVVTEARELLKLSKEGWNPLYECFFKFFMIVLCDRKLDNNISLLNENEHAALEKSSDTKDSKDTNDSKDSKETKENEVTAGFSLNDYKQVTLDGKLFLPMEMKKMIVEFLCHPAWNSTKVLPILLLASGCDNDPAAAEAQDRIKRLNEVNYENPEFVKTLYGYLQGTVTPQGKMNIKLPVKDRKAGIRGQAQLLVITHLIKSKIGVNLFPSNIQITFDCLFGKNTYPKLKVLGLRFFQCICENGADKILNAIGKTLLQGLKRVLDNTKPDGITNTQLCNLAYLNMGKLAKRQPNLFKNDLKWFHFLFKAIESEPKDIRLSISEALTSVINSYINHTPEIADEIQTSLLKTIESENSHCRLMSVICARVVFPLCHSPSRYICAIGASDGVEDVKNEGNRGLDKIIFHEQKQHTTEVKSEKLPNFEEITKFIAQKSVERYDDPYKRYHTGLVTMSFEPTLFRVLLEFIKKCLDDSAGIERVEHELSEQQELENRDKISAYFAGLEDMKITNLSAEIKANTDTITAIKNGTLLDIYRTLLEQTLNSTDNSLRQKCLNQMMDLANFNPSLFSQMNKSRIPLYRANLSSPNLVMRTTASRLIGMIVGYSNDEKYVKEFVDDVTKVISFAGSDLRKLDTEIGNLLCLGNVIGLSMKSFENLPPDTLAVFKKATIIIAKFLDNIRKEICSAACLALQYVAEFKALPLTVTTPDNDDYDLVLKNLKKDTVLFKDKEELSDLDVITRLIQLMKFSPQAPIVEYAVETLGKMGTSMGQNPNLTLIINSLLAMSRDNSPELQLTVGEALSRAGEKDIEKVLIAILENCKSTAPPVRQSSCLWLLCLVKYRFNSNVVMEKIKEIQKCFTQFLGDPGEFIQESAGKGLSILYEIGDAELKELLVTGLMKSLTSKQNTSNQKMDADSELHVNFGKTPDGSRINKYKDLCDLASEMNKPELVYKFMAVSNHNALWHTRKGAAFGLSSISDLASDKIEEFLPDLVPKLFRYKHDPSQRTREAMTAIWDSLNLESAEVLKTHAGAIIEDLLEHCISRSWRSREASCLGLSNIIGSYTKVLSILDRLWEMCFRAVDDQKETVRKAGMIFGKKLSSSTIAFVDPESNSPKTCNSVIQIVLPLFLEKGMISKVDEVAALSLQNIQLLVKKNAKAMNPFVAKVIPVLLEAQSDRENISLNYMSFHVEKMGLGQDKFEEARVAASKLSPMAEVIDLCLRHAITDEVLVDLVPKLVELVKGVGLNTKVAATSVLAELCDPRRGLNIKPHSKRMINCLLNSLTDPSPAVRKAGAVALSHVMKIASVASINRCIDKFTTLLTSDSGSFISAWSCLELGRNATDTFKKYQDRILPLVFIGTHVTDEISLETWTKVWDENSIGSTTAQKTYLKEILILVKPMLESNSYSDKICGAKVLSTLSKNVEGSLTPELSQELMTLLLKMMSGRTWAGKNNVMEALTSLSVSVTFSSEINKSVITTMLKECQRKDKEYRRFAIIHLKTLLAKHTEIDCFNDIFPIIEKNCPSQSNEIESDDEIEKKVRKPFSLMLQQAGFELLEICWPSDEQNQKEYTSKLVNIMEESLKGGVWNVKKAILTCFEVFISKTQPDILVAYIESTIDVIVNSIGDSKYSILRSTALKILKTIIERTNKKEITLSDPQINNVKKIIDIAKADRDANVRLIESEMENLQ